LQKHKKTSVTAVFTDIHGEFDCFETLLIKIKEKYHIHHYIFTGDVIDRGPNSKKVIDKILSLQNKYKIDCLMGNHEDMCFQNDLHWLSQGGDETVKSFFPNEKNIMLNYETFRKHISDYLKQIFNENKMIATYVFNNKRFIFSHAGGSNEAIINYLNGNSVYPFKESLIWDRKIFFEGHKELNLTNTFYVFGHTPVQMSRKNKFDEPIINYLNKEKNSADIALDTGCTYGKKLSALIIFEDGSFETISIKKESVNP
jgi:serine/threonine protein phosphatase 1